MGLRSTWREGSEGEGEGEGEARHALEFTTVRMVRMTPPPTHLGISWGPCTGTPVIVRRASVNVVWYLCMTTSAGYQPRLRMFPTLQVNDVVHKLTEIQSRIGTTFVSPPFPEACDAASQFIIAQGLTKTCKT